MRPTRIILPLFLAVLVVWPFVTDSYIRGLMIQTLILAIFAMSLDLQLGYTGLPSLGHAAYFGAAGFTTALLNLHVTENFWFTLGASLGVAAVMAVLFGLLALQTRGAYFLMITLALAQVLWGLATKWSSVTGGEDGLPGVGRPNLGLPFSMWEDSYFYFFVLLIFLIVLAFMMLLVRSPFGQTLQGIRENELRMRALGYNVWLFKYLGFIISGIFAGLSGMLFVYYNSHVSASNLGIEWSGPVLLMVILGGAGTLFGPIIGSAAYVFLESAISAQTDRWPMVLGMIYILVVLFAPKGLMGLIKGWKARRRST
jgi:branched-chain amino acid transport system permease protein